MDNLANPDFMLNQGAWHYSSLERHYGKGWAQKHALRELFQNLVDKTVELVKERGYQKADLYWKTRRGSEYGSDAQTMSRHEYITHEYIIRTTGEVMATISWQGDENTVSFTNQGQIPIKALFLCPTKDGEDPDTMGTHGEGLKMAMLVLLREEKIPSVSTGSHTWEFAFKRVQLPDDGLSQLEVLCFRVTQSVQRTSVRISIGNVNKTEWEDTLHQFLALRPPEDVKPIPASRSDLGSVLLGTRAQSELHVKGIFIKNEAQGAPYGLHFGFDVVQVRLNRDRDSVPDLWQRHRATSVLMADIANNLAQCENDYPWLHDMDLISKIYNALSVNDHTLYFFHESANVDVKNAIFLKWRENIQAGEDVQPVCPDAQKRVYEQMRVLGVQSSFYPYSATKVSNLLWRNIAGASGHYESLEHRVARLLRAAPLHNVLPAQQADIQVALNALAHLIPQGTMVQFKQFPSYIMRYKEERPGGGIDIFLSNQVLVYDLVNQYDQGITCVRKVAAKIFISLAEMLEIHFEHLLVSRWEEFRMENQDEMMNAPQEASSTGGESFMVVDEGQAAN